MIMVWSVSRDLRIGLSFALLGVFLFSLSLPMTKLALDGFNPFVTAFGRAAIAGMLAMVLLRVRKVQFPARELWRPIWFTVAGAVVGWPVLVALALERTTAAHTAVVASFMPLATAIMAVLRFRERVTTSFWIAAVTGTTALVVFSLSRGGAEGADLTADLLMVAAVLASAWCYVEGANLTRAMPGWQVISWVVVFALPISVPLAVVLQFVLPHPDAIPVHAWIGFFFIAFFSMYFGFFAWYRGLAQAGVARGSQMQQLQALLTLGWSVLLLGETVGLSTVLAALVVVASVVWAQASRRVAPIPTEMD
jgi:drug/metabolite transporter (DMT)-like permease